MDTSLSPAERDTLAAAKAANPHYFRALIDAAGIMAERRRKYSGTLDAYANFIDVQHLTGQPLSQVFLYYIAQKVSRLRISGDRDFADERVCDTLRDLANYALIWAGWVARCRAAGGGDDG